MNVHRLSLLAAVVAMLAAFDAAATSPAALRTAAATVAVETADRSVRKELFANARELLSQVAPEISLPRIDVTVPAIKLD